jgi:hypothetical protein
VKVGAALLVAALCAPQLGRYYEATKDDWRCAAACLEARARGRGLLRPGYAYREVPPTATETGSQGASLPARAPASVSSRRDA